jgi:hypothetical protein
LAIYYQRADGVGTAAEPLTKPEPGAAHVPESWSPPNGKLLSFSVAKSSGPSHRVDVSDLTRVTPASGVTFSLWTVSLTDKKATPFGGRWSRSAQCFPLTGRGSQIRGCGSRI